jgi:multidrug efflux pump
MLIGLVTKNGILIVEFARQLREEGRSRREAAAAAAAARFRPILMTAFSTILGTLPIALALGSGAESRVPMGLAVIGGMVVGTLLTLYVIPALYTFIATPDPAPAGLPDARGDGLAGALPATDLRLADGASAEPPRDA